MTGQTDMNFTAHNVRLADGSYTISPDQFEVAEVPLVKAAVRVLKSVYPKGLADKKVADLGCLEGGTTAALAREGAIAIGIEVRNSNFQNCLYVKERSGVKGLHFYKDDVWNLEKYSPYDSVFCCGLLYHLDLPYKFLKLISSCTRDAVILHTHYSSVADSEAFNLSPLVENEGYPGRWYAEHDIDDKSVLDAAKWASWENKRSFWPTKPALLQMIKDVGFDLVFEQLDFLENDIMSSMTSGWYKSNNRSMFVGIKVR